MGSVLVSLAQGQQQNFAVFLVNLREGNTAEYKPCDTFTGVSGEEMVEIECEGECEMVLASFVQKCNYGPRVQGSKDKYYSYEMTEVLMTILVFVRSRYSDFKVQIQHS